MKSGWAYSSYEVTVVRASTVALANDRRGCSLLGLFTVQSSKNCAFEVLNRKIGAPARSVAISDFNNTLTLRSKA